MVRRSFRLGLRLGILLGALAAVVKTVQSRRAPGAAEPAPVPEPWTPAAPPQPEARAEDVAMAEEHLTPVRVEPEPQAAGPAPVPAPEPEAEPEAERPVDEVGEPIVEVPPPEEPSVPEIVAPAGDDDILPTAGRRTRRPAAAPAPAPAAPAAKKAPAKKAPAAKKAAGAKKAAKRGGQVVSETIAPWVDPRGGVCPTSHPIKAKLSSKIFHLPGMFAFERTVPDRCYKDAESAVADGFRAARR